MASHTLPCQSPAKRAGMSGAKPSAFSLRSRLLLPFLGAGLSLLVGGCQSTSSGAGKSDRSVPSTLTEDEGDRKARAHAAFAKGLHHELLQQPELALDAFTEAALADPAHDELVIEVAQRQLQKKKPVKAIEVLRKAVLLPDPPPILFALLATAQAEAGQRSSAISSGRKAVQLAPENPFAYRSLFTALVADKQTSAALQVVESASKSSQTNNVFWIGLAELSSTLQSSPEPVKSRSSKLTIQLLGKCRQVEGQTNPLELQRMAELYEGAGEFSKAEALYEELLKRFPSVSALKSRLLGLYLRSGDRKRAMEQLEALAKASPTNPNVQYLLGSLSIEDKKPDQAIEYFERAIRLKPDFEEAYFDLASALMGKNEPQKALALLAEARKQLKNKFAVEFYSALANSRLKKYDDALKHLVEAEVLAKVDDPSRLNHFFYFQLGAIQERRGDFAAAETALRKSIELSPKFAEALNYLGYMWADRGENLKEAKALIDRALVEEPKNGAFLDSLAWVLFKMNRPQEALVHMKQAMEHVEDQDPTLFDHLGDIYFALNQKEKAAENWKKALELEPSEAIRKKLDGLKLP